VNAWLLLAASLALLAGAAHSYLGERYILTWLVRRTDSVFIKRTLRLAWHITSITWWGAAALFWALGRGSTHLGVQVLSATFLVTALMIAIGSRGRHLAWPVFLTIAIAAWLGAP
jgi:hypothetical protein